MTHRYEAERAARMAFRQAGIKDPSEQQVAEYLGLCASARRTLLAGLAPTLPAEPAPVAAPATAPTRRRVTARAAATVDSSNDDE